MADDNKIVTFRKAGPSVRLKSLDWTDKRAQCKHESVEVWSDEPILECRDCGAAVDPYRWIRDRCRDWMSMEDAVQYRVKEAKAEIAELKKALALLLSDYADEAEERRAKHALMVLPPQRTRY